MMSIGKPDTMIYLPNSKMQVGIKKGLTADKISQLDKYYSTHEISTKVANKISPMLPQCGYHTEFV